MTKTGTEIATAALRELQIIDAVEAASGEDAAHALDVGSVLVDNWRTQQLTIGGITRTVYSLTSGQQAHTIGSGGDFSQDWPSAIRLWSIIPDDDAANVREISMGRPYTYDEWQAIAVKSLTGARPTALWYDRAWSAGLGSCHFYPVPDNGDVDVALYMVVPSITSLVAATSYNLRPGAMLALILTLAVRLAPSFGVSLQTLPDLVGQQKEALADYKRSNIIPKEAPLKEEFIIGANVSRRTFNVRTGSS